MISIAERHKYILDALQKDGYVKVLDLAKQLDVTSVTIRKDLKILEEKGLLYRTHGSASPANPHAGDRNVTEKEKIKPEEKRRIGQAAAKLIEKNDSIIINSGSTICMFAEQIEPVEGLTVVSASVMALTILSQKEPIHLIQLGGTYRKKSASVIGSYTQSFLKGITCSKLFLGVDGIDMDFGVTTSNIEEAELNKSMMDVVSKTIVLADSSKFGRKGFGKICDIDKIDVIITDSGIPPSMIKKIEEQGIELIIT
ncbi:DeoR/GlpR family DNA-binding transcription regulator [Parabacteroides sp. PF5-6]|uniref:DeoR/GlpR family DNA-binding transcription regulator n=1 Tax=Parabacteroides sp. PF5-6 TaxID=1742403 RepID=UPI0024073570|nr:DeoR/GlpR family DNA-binding transcription regulator [Parabacteroides sp. PF5-6]MDF9830608.1 DeoR family transcriptional regulator of aga operon [Parabacteroides sp. PF5-6]